MIYYEDYAELKAENARLQVEAVNLKEVIADLRISAEDDLHSIESARIENTRLKSENESLMTSPTSRLLRAERKENARLQAEVERLTFDPFTYLDDQGEWMPRHIHLAAVERLQAEVESVRQVAQDNKTETEATRIENARLKAEVERLTAFTTRTIIPNEQLQAEVERLTKAGDAMHTNIPKMVTSRITSDEAIGLYNDWIDAKEGKDAQ